MTQDNTFPARDRASAAARDAAPDMTDYEKMRAGLLYRGSADIRARLLRANELNTRLRTLDGRDPRYRELLRELLPGMHEKAIVTPPFHCDLGCGITLKERAYLNAGCILLDMGRITIGRYSMLGPGCLVCTPHHPIDAIERRDNVQYAFPVTIGDSCWLGAGVIVCPGVTIGDRCIVAAGAVLTRDLPPDSLAAGSPARVMRKLTKGETGRLEQMAMEREAAMDPADAAALTAFERMRDGLGYNPVDDDIQAVQAGASKLCAELRTACIREERCRTLLNSLVPDLAPAASIVPPLHCDFGSGLVMEDGAFINYNGTVLDSATVRVGAHTLIGPRVQLSTPHHPMDAERRKEKLLYAFPINIGEDCWLGGGVTVCPGVTIGDRSIIAAGSVVTHDIPADSLAAGVPAKVKRSLVSANPEAERDAEYLAGTAGTEGMTELEKMRAAKLYDFGDADMILSNFRAGELCARLQTAPMHSPEWREILRELIPGIPDSSGICPPFHCDHGHGIRLGEHVFMNADCTILD
ncbi:MAG: DapH/DapD/GlmU-related protein, partial [Desulfovibrionaceae bacterium]|nr:DapH/DapD/GlmU-related protein [Desulfovibrionaceae bacterium]